MQLVIAFIILASLAIRNAQAGISGGNWVDPDPADLDSLNIYYCEDLSPGDTIMTFLDSIGIGSTFGIAIQDADASSVFEVVGSDLKIKTDADNAIYDFEGETDIRNVSVTLTFTNGPTVIEITAFLVAEDVNEFSPTFGESSYEVSVSENISQDASVLQVNATDDDGTSSISYQILDGENSTYFSIDPDTGIIIYTPDAPLGDLTEVETLTFQVQATDGNSSDSLNGNTTVVVKFLPVPEFIELNTVQDVHVDENTVGGIYTVNYTAAETVIYQFTLTNQTCEPPYFELNENEVVTAANQSLDKETSTDPCNLTFRLSDGVHDVLSSTLTVYLVELNDNAPVFSEYNPERVLPEHLEVGAEIYTAQATDDDIGNPDNIMIYSLAGEGMDMFRINSSSGVISLAASLDYTTKNDYNLTLTAADSQENPLTRTTFLYLTVITGPKFQNPEDGDIITIAEVDTGDGTLAKSLTVVDEDGDASEITLESQNPDDIFVLSGNDLIWKQTVDVDDENAVLSYTVTLKATDGKSETNDDQITFTINLEDSNDELPVFVSQSYSETVGEHLSAGATVLTVEANDRDVTEEYSHLEYSLTSEDGSHTDFSIDTDTGVISVAQALDYTAISTYNLTAVAKDISNDPKSSTVPVTIYVAAGPVITSPQDGQKFNISEDDTENRTPVVTIEVTDEDEDGTIALEVISQTPETEPFRFEINPNGQLVPKASVDADLSDEDPVFTLQIRASDGIPFSTDHTITVTVQVYDSNEAPQFTNELETIEVPERAEVGTIVYVANASDPDKTSAYRPISYTVSGSRDNFKIFDNGSLVISAPLDYTRARTHDLTIRARNIPESMLYTTMHLIIYVLTAPEFVNLKESFTVEIEENKGGEIVFDLHVNDKDGQERGTEIVTSIESQSPSMKLVLEGLSLKTIEGGLDAEEEQELSVTLKADDTEFETYSAQLKVKVIDLNDNSPVIEDVEDITIDENKATSGSGSEIVLVEATDGDATAANNMLTWTIISGNDDNYFAINPTTGMLSLVKTPVSQVPLEYTLTVEVADNGSPQNKETTSFTISINGEAVDECAESPCQNGGDCTSYTNTYICDCADGFEGDNCEINIDDCDPCNNGGICSDGVNSFSCDCAEGWTGDTCLEECNNNKYGRNCANTCDCDGTRLASDAGNQACDVKNGDCKCNEFWRGSKCENDINECAENLHNCNDVPNTVCRNVNGSFSCVCKTKHTLVNNVCTKDPPRSVRPKDGEVAILLRCKLELPCPNLDDREVYREEEDKIIITVTRQLKTAIVVFVVDIWCGSLEFETTIITNDTADDRAELANEIQKIRDASSIQYGGNDVPVLNVFVNDKELLPTSQSSETMETKVCEVFTSYTSCSTDEECRYEDGKPTCLPPKKDNLALILGLGLGLTLPLLCLAFLAVVLWNMKRREGLKRRRWERKMMSSRDGSFATRYYDNGKYSGSVSRLSGFSNLPEEAVVTYPYKFNA